MDLTTDLGSWYYVTGHEPDYILNPYGEVWSRDRVIKTAHGVDRHYKGRRLSTARSKKNVILSHNGRSESYSIDELVRATLGHPRLDPRRPEIWRRVWSREDCEVSDYGRVRNAAGVLPIVGGKVTLDGEQVVALDLYREAFSEPDHSAWDGNRDTLWRPWDEFPGYEMSLSQRVRKADRIEVDEFGNERLVMGREVSVKDGEVVISKDGKRHRRTVAKAFLVLFDDLLNSTERNLPEVWYPVVGFGGWYRDTHEVSSYYRVRRHAHWVTNKGRREFVPEEILPVERGVVTLSKQGRVEQESVCTLLVTSRETCERNSRRAL